MIFQNLIPSPPPPPGGPKSAFALIVVAALFVAFSVVAAVVIEKKTVTQQITLQDDTRAQLSRLSNAVIQYYLFNTLTRNRYPCPAPVNVLPTAASFGVAITNCHAGQALPAGITGLPNNVAADPYIRGMVPVVTLAPYGITLEDAFDQWGNRIMYVVDRNLVPTGTGTASTTRATLTEWNVGSIMLSPDFLTISYGRDKLGGFPKGLASTTPAIACATSGTQIRDNNCNGSLDFTMGPNRTGSTVTVDNYFDDVVSSYQMGGSSKKAYCWGQNDYGQVGDGTTVNRSTPVLVPLPTGVSSFKQITTSNYSSCAIGNNNLPYCWGYGGDGQLGNGTCASSLTLVQFNLPTGVSSFTQISHTYYYSCGIGNNGRAYCAGVNSYGQLGNPPTPSWGTCSPVEFTLPSGVTSFTQIAVGTETTCGIGNNGRAYCAGANIYGQLGDGTLTNNNTPVAVILPSGVTSFTQVAASSRHTCGIGNNGRAYCWGNNDNGQFGNGTSTSSTTPVAVNLPTGVTSFTQISPSYYFTCGIGNNGLAYCWGRNDYGQLGNGTNNWVDTPAAVTLPSGVTSFTQISAKNGATVCAIGNNGLAYCWGRNDFGQVGDGTTINRSTPVAVNLPTGASSFTQIETGYTTCAITN